ncbi:MAG TPA: hypothetical protein VGA53_01500 [Candidatus Paceibacterota bacterium]
MNKRQSIVLAGIVGALVVAAAAWFAYFRQPQEEPPQERQAEELIKEEELRRENTAPRAEPLSEERKVELREENE